MTLDFRRGERPHTHRLEATRESWILDYFQNARTKGYKVIYGTHSVNVEESKNQDKLKRELAEAARKVIAKHDAATKVEIKELDLLQDALRDYTHFGHRTGMWASDNFIDPPELEAPQTELPPPPDTSDAELLGGFQTETESQVRTPWFRRSKAS